MKQILEEYLNQGFQWIYKYDVSKVRDKSKTTRIFYDEPWFSIEGGLNWVDLNSCEGLTKPERQAKFIDLDIAKLEKPIRISEYINKYC